MQENNDRRVINLPKDEYDKFKNYCDINGLSLPKWIMKLCNNEMKNINKKLGELDLFIPNFIDGVNESLLKDLNIIGETDRKLFAEIFPINEYETTKCYPFMFGQEGIVSSSKKCGIDFGDILKDQIKVREKDLGIIKNIIFKNYDRIQHPLDPVKEEKHKDKSGLEFYFGITVGDRFNPVVRVTTCFNFQKV